MEHAKVTKYSYFIQRSRKEFDRRKLEKFHKESLHTPPAAKVLTSGVKTLASL